jgi:hypothetical protein
MVCFKSGLSNNKIYQYLKGKNFKCMLTENDMADEFNKEHPISKMSIT